MTASHASAPHATHYYVPQPSLYPIFLSGGMFLLALGFILLMNMITMLQRHGSWRMRPYIWYLILRNGSLLLHLDTENFSYRILPNPIHHL